MKSTERTRILAIYGRFYRTHYTEQRSCFYCDEPATDRDHAPPVAWVESNTITQWRKMRIPLVKVLACAECNRLIGSKPLFTTRERLEFLDRSLTDRYEKATNLWTDEEISEMSPQFAKTIRARRSALIGLHRRICAVQRRRARTWTHPNFDEDGDYESDDTGG